MKVDTRTKSNLEPLERRSLYQPQPRFCGEDMPHKTHDPAVGDSVRWLSISIHGA